MSSGVHYFQTSYSTVLREQTAFASENPSPIEELIKEFRIQDALDLLKTVYDSNNEIFTEFLLKEPESFIKLVHWLVDRCLTESDEKKAALRNLPLWLSNRKLHPLGELVVPGSFVDELKLGKIIDTEGLKIIPDRLFDIGANKPAAEPRSTIRRQPVQPPKPTRLRRSWL